MSNSSHSIKEVIFNRHSSREFDITKDVTYDHINSILEAGRWAPSCYGDQPWRFLIAMKKEHQNSFDLILNSMVPFNQSWAQHASVLIVIVSDTKFSKNDNFNRWADYDTGAAAQNMSLMAYDMGIMTHQIGGFDQINLKKSFMMDDSFNPLSIMALGYDKKHDIEPRERRPLDDICFFGTFT